MLFEPTNQNLKTEYPELDTIDEFATLNNSDMLFVWYMENPDSQFHAVKPLAKRVDDCIMKSYKLGSVGSLTSKEIEAFQKGRFPDHISRALDRMKRFSPEKRKQAKDMVDTIFDKFRAIIKTPPTDLLSDTAVQKNYIDNAIKITESLPILLRRIEEGFGYKNRAKKDEATGPTLMDKAGQHESND